MDQEAIEQPHNRDVALFVVHVEAVDDVVAAAAAAADYVDAAVDQAT